MAAGPGAVVTGESAISEAGVRPASARAAAAGRTVRRPLMRRFVGAAAGFALVLPLGRTAVAGPETGSDDLYVVTHVDVAPRMVTPARPEQLMAAVSQVTRKGAVLLERLAATCHRDAGCLGFDVLQQTDAPNHFTLLQHWSSNAAFAAGESDPQAREIRAELQPLLGAPWDERLHRHRPLEP